MGDNSTVYQATVVRVKWTGSSMQWYDPFENEWQSLGTGSKNDQATITTKLKDDAQTIVYCFVLDSGSVGVYYQISQSSSYPVYGLGEYGGPTANATAGDGNFVYFSTSDTASGGTWYCGYVTASTGDDPPSHRARRSPP